MTRTSQYAVSINSWLSQSSIFIMIEQDCQPSNTVKEDEASAGLRVVAAPLHVAFK